MIKLLKEPLLIVDEKIESKIFKIKAKSARNSTLLRRVSKLPFLWLTLLTYIHVGDAEIGYFGLNFSIHQLIEVPLNNLKIYDFARLAINTPVKTKNVPII